MWLTGEWGKMKKCLACLRAWGRVGSRSSETDLPLQVVDLSSAGERKESRTIFQKGLVKLEGRNTTMMASPLTTEWRRKSDPCTFSYSLEEEKMV